MTSYGARLQRAEQIIRELQTTDDVDVVLRLYREAEALLVSCEETLREAAGTLSVCAVGSGGGEQAEETTTTPS